MIKRRTAVAVTATLVAVGISTASATSAATPPTKPTAAATVKPSTSTTPTAKPTAAPPTKRTLPPPTKPTTPATATKRTLPGAPKYSTILKPPLVQAFDTSLSTFRTRIVNLWAAAEATTPFYLVRPDPVPPSYFFTGAMSQPCDAHHIVPRLATGAALARYYMAVGGINVNDTKNGVLLTTVYHHALHAGASGQAYIAYQNSEFVQFGNLPNGKTSEGAAYYSSLYLSQSRDNLNSDGGCLGVWAP